MYAQGINDHSDNGLIWIGDDGPNVFTFGNGADVSTNIVVWYQDDDPINYAASFMSAEQPYITYSLAPNEEVVISMANGVSGAISPVLQGQTVLSEYGQIYNTWVEFTTGDYATMDVSREVNMDGVFMAALISSSEGGGYIDNTLCAYVCYSGVTCGDAGTYELLNCDPAAGSNAEGAYIDGEWTGGMQGWSNGGDITVLWGNY